MDKETPKVSKNAFLFTIQKLELTADGKAYMTIDGSMVNSIFYSEVLISKILRRNLVGLQLSNHTNNGSDQFQCPVIFPIPLQKSHYGQRPAWGVSV